MKNDRRHKARQHDNYLNLLLESRPLQLWELLLGLLAGAGQLRLLRCGGSGGGPGVGTAAAGGGNLPSLLLPLPPLTSTTRTTPVAPGKMLSEQNYG